MELYELFFPKKKVRFNKNIHKASPFMTAGLLVSRKTKNDLYTVQLTNNSPENIAKYKAYKQNYFKIVRAAKKNFISKTNCKKIQKIQKKHGKLSMKPWANLNQIQMSAKSM
jgi:hypothetical protein